MNQTNIFRVRNPYVCSNEHMRRFLLDCLNDALLERYLNDELDAAVLCSLQQHARECERCKDELVYWQYLLCLRRDESIGAEVPPNFACAVMSKITGVKYEDSTSLINL